MRSTILLTALAALASATPDPITSPLTLGSSSVNINSYVSSAFAHASAELNSLSKVAATATGALGSTLRSEYSSLKSELASAESSVSAIEASTSAGGGGSGSTTRVAGGASSTAASVASSASGATNTAGTSSSGGLAAATAVPVVMGAVGMAVIAML